MTVQAELNPTYGLAYTMRESEPKNLMTRIMDENPNARPHAIYKLFADEAKDDPAVNEACLLAMAVNLYSSIARYRETPAQRRIRENTQRTEARQRREQVKEVVERVRHAFILDTILPDGKTARQSTGKSLTKYGGALATIGALVKPQQIVGKHVTDEQAQKILGGA